MSVVNDLRFSALAISDWCFVVVGLVVMYGSLKRKGSLQYVLSTQDLYLFLYNLVSPRVNIGVVWSRFEMVPKAFLL